MDEKGNDWQIGRSYAYAARIGKDGASPSQFKLNEGDFSLTEFRNKYRPKNVEPSTPGTFLLGEGDYDCDRRSFRRKARLFSRA